MFVWIVYSTLHGISLDTTELRAYDSNSGTLNPVDVTCHSTIVHISALGFEIRSVLLVK